MLLYCRCQSKLCISVQNILLQQYIIYKWRKLREHPPLAIAGCSECTEDFAKSFLALVLQTPFLADILVLHFIFNKGIHVIYG